MTFSRTLSVDDPLQLSSIIQPAHTEVLPATKGDFRAHVVQVRLSKIWMSRFKFDTPHTSTSATGRSRRIVGFVTEGTKSALHHCGVDVTHGDLIAARFDFSHERADAGLQCGAMSLPADELPTICTTIIGRELPDNTPENHITRPDSGLMSRLLELHRTVGHLAHDSPDVLALPEVARALEHELTLALVKCLADGHALELGKGTLRQAAVINRFDEFLAANPNRPLYLAEICAAIGVAERTLRAACEEFMGMGPIRFLTLRRMHLVRAALLRAEPSTTTVTRVLTDHGFWEFGRFSAGYHELFGELPSATLQRPSQELALGLDRPTTLAAQCEPRFHLRLQ
jgi:AraC-like DNA-binding protein